jgi:hypothetical protein
MRLLALACAGLMTSPAATALDHRGDVTMEGWAFAREGAQAQSALDAALRFRADIWHRWNEGRDAITLSPFVRIDTNDSERNHADMREASWVHAGDAAEWRAGIRQVFWGVTEGTHLVDIINQTDAIESLDGEHKLGQPMLNVSVERDAHLLDFFVLTGSRERTFPGEDGRLRLPLVVDTQKARYESSKENHRVDLAARWQFTWQGLRAGLSAFSGTAREPELLAEIDPTRLVYGAGGVPVGFQPGYQPFFIPFYPVIRQVGLDAQITQGDLLWKLETVQRSGYARNYHSTNAGIEYTQVGAFGSDIDIGWLAEYLHDSRNGMATTPFEHDVLVGWRVAFNNAASTELLASVIVDDRSGERLFSLEGSHRLGERLKVTMELRHISHTRSPQSAFDFVVHPDMDNKLRPLADDDFLRLEASWFF